MPSSRWHSYALLLSLTTPCPYAPRHRTERAINPPPRTKGAQVMAAGPFGLGAMSRPAAARSLLFLLLASLVSVALSNSTDYWLGRRAALTDSVFGLGPGVLPTRSVPDQVLSWRDERRPKANLTGLVWNMTTMFPITSTVVFSPAAPQGPRSKSAVFFHHGHSNCICQGSTPLEKALCRPGCNSSMPTGSEVDDAGYTWWDLYNVSAFVHGLGHDLFVFSMPLKGINLGPGTTSDTLNTDHWWFLQWEDKGDFPMRYFVEPVVLTANYAKAQGYDAIFMAGLSGGGWSTTLAPALDNRINA